MGKAWASCCGWCSAVDWGRGSQEESMASSRETLFEILDYRGFVGSDSVSYPQCSGQLGGSALILHGLDSVPELFGARVTGCKVLLGKLRQAFSN